MSATWVNLSAVLIIIIGCLLALSLLAVMCVPLYQYREPILSCLSSLIEQLPVGPPDEVQGVLTLVMAVAMMAVVTPIVTVFILSPFFLVLRYIVEPIVVVVERRWCTERFDTITDQTISGLDRCKRSPLRAGSMRGK